MDRISPFLLLSFILFLPACSYFDAGEPVATAQQIDLMEGEAREEITVLEGDLDSELDPSVEIFPLDGTVPDVTYQTSRPVQDVQPFKDMAFEEPAFNFDEIELAQIEREFAEPLDHEVVVVDDVLVAPVAPVESAQEVVGTVSLPAISAVVVTFDHGSAALDAGDVNILEDVAAGYGGDNLSVIGYASSDSVIDDPIARKLSNLKLSMDRAYSAARVLIGGGVPSGDILVSGAGETQADDPAQARRVEVFAAEGAQ